MYNEIMKQNILLFFRKNLTMMETVIPYQDGTYWVIFDIHGKMAVERIDNKGYYVRTSLDVNWKYNNFDVINEAIEDAVRKVASFKKETLSRSYSTQMIGYHI